MEVFEFRKCLLDRLDECCSVLPWKDEHIPASRVRSEWSYFIELQVEPAGWQALWKIPRVVCEQMKIRFPAIVFGNVEQVLFKELKAIFVITAVQDDNVHLPERQEVSLEDLWPTICQENDELNVEHTADCLDQLRFFYNHVWMPWDNDNDDDIDWVQKHLESRIRLCFDLCQCSISRPLSTYCRSIISEAKYIQQKRQHLESDLSDNEDNQKANETISEKKHLAALMRLHLRMSVIRSDFELLENPEMRSIYEEIKYKEIQSTKSEILPVIYVILLCSTIDHHLEYLNAVKKRISKNDKIYVNHSLQDVLNICKASDKIYLSPGCHTVNFRDYFKDGGLLHGLSSITTYAVTIYSLEDNTNLLVFNGNFTLENLILDCRNITCGIFVKSGHVTIKNCKLLGNGISSTQQGISCSGHSKLTIENSLVENFATGIKLSDQSTLIANKSSINNCSIGIEINDITCVDFLDLHINNSREYGIYYNAVFLDKTEKEYITLDNINDLESFTSKTALYWSGKCNFTDCNTNIMVFNNNKSFLTTKTIDYINQSLSNN